MPILDSFTVDHTRMKAPAVRIAKIIKTIHDDIITVFDLRFYQPNLEFMPEKGSHTFEHLFAVLMRNNLNNENIKIIDISPMGCRTGFYMSIIGILEEQQVIEAWETTMKDILKVKNQKCIPELNKYQCGTYQMHSLQEAQEIAQYILNNIISINYNDELILSKEILTKLNTQRHNYKS